MIAALLCSRHGGGTARTPERLRDVLLGMASSVLVRDSPVSDDRVMTDAEAVAAFLAATEPLPDDYFVD